MSTELTPQQVKNLERLAKIVKSGDIGIFEHLVELEGEMQKTMDEVQAMLKNHSAEVEKAISRVPDTKSILEQVKGKDGESIVGPKGEDGDDGETIVGPMGPAGKDGKNGKDGKDGQSIVGPAGKDGKDANEAAIQDRIEKNLPSLGVAMRDGLELLPDGEKLKIDAVQDLPKRLEALEKRPIYTGNQPGGIIGRDIIKDYDLSASLDGVTKVFQLPATWNIISVDLSSYPYGSLRKNVDYTYTTTSITFTATIDAATQLAAGQQCILTLVTA